MYPGKTYAPRIPYGRFYDEEEGIYKFILPPSAPSRDGYEYYNSEKHAGHLMCPDCTAKLDVNYGHISGRGNIPSRQRPHFRTGKGQTHDFKCEYTPEKTSHVGYDSTKGYRAHVNIGTLHETFNYNADPYFRDEDGRFKLKKKFEYLTSYQPYSINNLDDLVRLIKRGDKERLRDTQFIHRGVMLQLPEFLIRYSRNSHEPQRRFIALYERLASMPKHHQLQLCAMEVRTRKGVMPYADGNGRDFIRGVSKSAFWYQDQNAAGDTRKHFIVPRVFLDEGEGRSHEADYALKDAGDYLVLGYARLGAVRHSRDDTAVFHFINMSITKKADIKPIDLDKVAAQAQKNAQKRAAEASGPLIR